MSIMLNDLRSRISEIEKYLGMDKHATRASFHPQHDPTGPML